MSEYDGSWENDPLDLRCIRLDAEMEAGLFCSKEPVFIPRTLEDCYKPEFDDYTRCATAPKERFLKPLVHCFIINKDDDIVERDVHDPFLAKQKILKNYDKTHRIFITSELRFISLEEADAYE